MIALKPCPFCGKTPEMLSRIFFSGPSWQLAHKCEVFGSMSYWEDSVELLVNRWNTRTQPMAELKSRS
jgi:Lar family restriction alleviation protein